MAHWFAPPLPPNRTGGFPASGSAAPPQRHLMIEGVGRAAPCGVPCVVGSHPLPVSMTPCFRNFSSNASTVVIRFNATMGLCHLPPSLYGSSDPDLTHDIFDRSHSNHPTGRTVQLGHGMRRRSVEPLAQASPTPPGALSGRCDCYASSPPAKAESSSLAFRTGLLPRDTPDPASRRRSSPQLPARRVSQADSDFHWLVSWFHQLT
jgi:hypothetical protein